MRVEAQLKHRGENFEVTVNGRTFEGFCSWTYEEKAGETNPVPSYPVAIEAETISRVGIGSLFRLSPERQKRIAVITVSALEESEAGSEYVAFFRGAEL